MNERLARVLVTSLPKSGTNVLESILARFPGMTASRKLGLNSRMRYHPINWLAIHKGERCLVGMTRPQSVRLAAVRFSLSQLNDGKYALSHIPYQESVHSVLREMEIAPIFVIRDPRDVVVSAMHHAVERRNHFLHREMMKYSTPKDRLKAIISGGVTDVGIRYLGIGEQLECVAGWYKAKHVLTVKFEDIIGPRGGGSIQDQVRTIVSIGNFIGRPVNDDAAARIGESMFGKGSTFRKGTTGAWKDEFDDDLIGLFKEKAEKKMKVFGYDDCM